ncbi:MAG: NAD(P)H-hydrate dehydratase [Candidatus Omnitrophota bacterium]
MGAPSEIFSRIIQREPDSHKGNYGHSLVLAGSCRYTGAPYFTVQGALLSGCGLVTLGIGRSLYPIMASKLNEAMIWPLFETQDLSLSILSEREIIRRSENVDVFAAGPGMSTNKETQQLVKNLILKTKKPFVVDADGITALSTYPDTLKKAEAPIVITPHPGEMSRLSRKSIGEIEDNREAAARDFAKENRCTVVLKGSGTIVASHTGEMYVNDTGNPGMATGGTGDILTGMIAGLMCQGLDAHSASVLGVYAHGLAGDIAVKEKGALSLLATDILNYIPAAFCSVARSVLA